MTPICPTLREKCPCSELFWSAFSCIRTEYGEMFLITPYSVRMQKNADQNNSKYGHFLRSAMPLGELGTSLYFDGLVTYLPLQTSSGLVFESTALIICRYVIIGFWKKSFFFLLNPLWSKIVLTNWVLQ